MSEIVVSGGGLAGLTAGLALAEIAERRGRTIRVVAPRPKISDQRTTALLKPSADYLAALGLQTVLEENGAPLKTMRLIDGSNRLVRAPVTAFHASEADISWFGINIVNHLLADALRERLAAHRSVEMLDSWIVEQEVCASGEINLKLGDETIVANLHLAADGRNSPARLAAGIGAREWSYPQEAIVFCFAHSLPHSDVSNEFHRENGPFTTVPLPVREDGRPRSSLVWAMAPGQAEPLVKGGEEKLAQRAEEIMHSMLGRIEIDSPIQVFPFGGLTADRFADKSTVLLGEAAHAFPPIGAQGFNLGLRDVETAIRLIDANWQADGHIDSQAICSAYHRERAADIHGRTAAVDMLNRSLLSGFLPVQIARASILSLLGNASPIRKLAMRAGLGQPLFGNQPGGNKSGGSRPVEMA